MSTVVKERSFPKDVKVYAFSTCFVEIFLSDFGIF